MREMGLNCWLSRVELSGYCVMSETRQIVMDVILGRT